MPSVLLVEDDHAMATALRLGFEHENYTVLTANDGSKGLDLAREQAPDIIILDVMLPTMSGLDVCRRLRDSAIAIPIIMLTARGQELDKVVGLRAGADDYLTKPFSFLELLARVEAVLRRSNKPRKRNDTYQFGNITIDFRNLSATKEGQPLTLSKREFAILQYFIEHRGEVVTRDVLLNAVWGYSAFPLSRTVDTWQSCGKKLKTTRLLPCTSSPFIALATGLGNSSEESTSGTTHDRSTQVSTGFREKTQAL